MNNIVEVIDIENSKYPKALKKIYDPPKELYTLGNISLLESEDMIAIVGCRECTEYGRKCAKYFSHNLAKRGKTIVSGLAKGIDAYAHIAALEVWGKTIAVLGNGIDIIYPKENKFLFQLILDRGGLIISEYPLGTKPSKMTFPARNRIISGMSKGVIVVEAQKESGALITADFAVEQGKDVYAVPGNINSKNSVGTNELIKQGAIPITNFKDII